MAKKDIDRTMSRLKSGEIKARQPGPWIPNLGQEPILDARGYRTMTLQGPTIQATLSRGIRESALEPLPDCLGKHPLPELAGGRLNDLHGGRPAKLVRRCPYTG